MNAANIDPIIHLIETHGLSLVLLVLMITFWFVPWVQKLSSKDDLSDEYQSLIEKREESQAFTEKVFKADAEINIIISEMLHHYAAQWVTLWQFHNGVNSIAGVPFLKISATHERTAANVNPKAYLFKEMPVSLFLDNSSTLVDKEVMSISVCDCNANAAIRNLMSSSDIKKSFIGIVRGVNGGLIGVITMGFLEEIWLSDEDYDHIRSFTSRTAIALSNLVFLNDENKKLSYKN